MADGWRWDMVVVCAGSGRQQHAFELQLRELYPNTLASHSIRVFADQPDGVKIGI
jgi:hypothetical protein